MNNENGDKIIMLNTKDSATINTYDVNTNNSEKTNFNPHLEAIFNTKQVKTYESEAKQIKLGSRCLLSDGFRKGEIAFNGLIPELGAGYFIGIKLDEPMGNCNGK